MPKKRSSPANGLVYSTDPDFKVGHDKEQDETTIIPPLQRLRVWHDNRHRAGKVVTIVEGFHGNLTDLEELAKKIKTFCGSGGSVKAGEIIIQGNNADKIIQWLFANGYISTKRV